MIEKIEAFFKNLLTDLCVSNLTEMFDSINSSVSEIGMDVGKTPESWNSSIFAMVRTLSETVIIPIAGMIITAILCYELIQMVTDKNNLNDSGTYVFFKFAFKGGIAVYLLSHTFDITMAIFDVGRYVVSHATSVINSTANIDTASMIDQAVEMMEQMGIGELCGLVLITLLLRFAMLAVSILIMVMLINRMIQIYIYCSVAPIPFATITNRDWGNTGTNYVRGLLALAFQGFFMMVCVGIYAQLVNSISFSGSLLTELLKVAGYAVALCMALYKTDSISKSIFNAS